MRISYLKSFLAVAETGGFMSAAALLNRTPSAISLQMKALEEAFGTELFDRTKRPPVLNQKGRSILGMVHEVVQTYGKLEEALSPEGFSGEIAIGSMPTTLTGILPKALIAYQRRYPQLVVRLVDDESSGLVARLKSGKIDAAIISTPRENDGSITWRPVAREPLVVIAPADAKVGDYRQILEDLPYIRFNNNAWTGRIIEEQLQKRNIKVNTMMELDNLEAIATMVYYGLGVSIMPLHCVDTPVRLPLKQIPFGNPQATRTIGLAEVTDNPRSKAIQGFFEELVAVSLSPQGAANPVS